SLHSFPRGIPVLGRNLRTQTNTGIFNAGENGLILYSKQLGELPHVLSQPIHSDLAWIAVRNPQHVRPSGLSSHPSPPLAHGLRPPRWRSRYRATRRVNSHHCHPQWPLSVMQRTANPRTGGSNPRYAPPLPDAMWRGEYGGLGNRRVRIPQSPPRLPGLLLPLTAVPPHRARGLLNAI